MNSCINQPSDYFIHFRLKHSIVKEMQSDMNLIEHLAEFVQFWSQILAKAFVAMVYNFFMSEY
jgi:hypothetical protein